MKRCKISPRMEVLLSWGWEIGLICIAIYSTALIMELSEDMGSGVDWGVPWAFSAIWILFTVTFIKAQLKKEKEGWEVKGGIVNQQRPRRAKPYGNCRIVSDM